MQDGIPSLLPLLVFIFISENLAFVFILDEAKLSRCDEMVGLDDGSDTLLVRMSLT